MNKKKVIITGGLGFIGSNLVELLINKNFNVIKVFRQFVDEQKDLMPEYQMNSPSTLYH